MDNLSGVGKNLWSDESGQALTEYGLILGLIALAVFSSLFALGNPLVTIYTVLRDQLFTFVQ